MERSENDHRKYRVITLDNELEVLLIGDKSTHKSAACLTVDVGSNSENIPGLAHIVEHLLFMGSRKYPDVNTFDEAVKTSFGSQNASTSSMLTSYYFDCVSFQFERILDIFSQFFICPLFLINDLRSEMNSIDEEFRTNKDNDDKRFDRGIAQFYNRSHPKFILHDGNNHLLYKDDIYDQSMKFFNTYYSSNIMKLVVVDRLALSEMEFYVRHIFNKIPNKNVRLNYSYGRLFPKDSRIHGHILSKKEIYQSRIIWEFRTFSRNNPVYNFVLYLIEFRGTDSLFETLYKRLIINDINASLSEQDDYSTLEIDIQFTKNGWYCRNYIYNLIKRYMILIRDSNKNDVKRLYNIYRRSLLLKYKYYIPLEPIKTVEILCRNWIELKLNPHCLISHFKVLPKFSTEVYEMIIEFINSIIGELTSKNFL